MTRKRAAKIQAKENKGNSKVTISKDTRGEGDEK